MLNSDEIGVQGEEMAQSMFKDKANDVKDSADVIAYQVLDEMFEPH